MLSARLVWFEGLAAVALLPASALATSPAAGDGGPSGTDSTLDEATEKLGLAQGPARRWIDRWPAEARLFELGAYGGGFLLNARHELFQPRPERPKQGFRALNRRMPSMGIRLGSYPARTFGLEVEAGVMPTQTVEDDFSAVLWSTRLHAVVQFGSTKIVPFVFAGAGAIGVASDPVAVGNDIDPAFDLGVGLKLNLSAHVQLRLDVRDVLTHQQGRDNTLKSNNVEATLGLAIVMGRVRPPSALPTPPPRRPEPKVAVAPDADGDGVIDASDSCVNEVETVNGFQDDDGCPENDRDGDGFWDRPAVDACPDEAGIGPDGCPIRDSDADGLLDLDDKCVDAPETINGFQDGDGCPDEVPKEVEAFTGVIEGLYFETGQATLTPKSETVLAYALSLLLKFGSIRVEISGHTDARGSYERNLDLSKRRAESVKTYLVEHGVGEARVEVIGWGP
ncbi:MAG: OmpA family protein [Nannocystaceae bacterium]